MELPVCDPSVTQIPTLGKYSSMRHFAVACSVFLAMTGACSMKKTDGSADCTLRAIGAGTGVSTIHVTLMVPDARMHGVEIKNGGVILLRDNCDFLLNAVLSDETANYIIDNAPKDTLRNRVLQSIRMVEASLLVWKFSDGSGEPRFFVMSVQDMAPILHARTAHESQYYRFGTAPR